MNGLTRNAAYLAVAVVAAVITTFFLWPAVWTTSPGAGLPIRDALAGVALASVVAMFLRLLYLAILGDGWTVRLLAAACIAGAFGFVAFIGIVVLVGTSSGAA